MLRDVKLIFCFFIVSAEFIIHLAEENGTFESFKKVLMENDADFSVCYLFSLFRQS